MTRASGLNTAPQAVVVEARVEFDEEVILGYDLWGMRPPPWCGGSSGYAPVSTSPILYRYAHIGNHIATSGHLPHATTHLRRPSHAACGKFLGELLRPRWQPASYLLVFKYPRKTEQRPKTTTTTLDWLLTY